MRGPPGAFKKKIRSPIWNTPSALASEGWRIQALRAFRQASLEASCASYGLWFVCRDVWLFVWLVAGWLAGWLSGRVAGWLDGWLSGLVAGWLAG